MIREFSFKGIEIQYDITNLNPDTIILTKVVRDGADVTLESFRDPIEFNNLTHMCHEDHRERIQLMEDDLDWEWDSMINEDHHYFEN